MKLRLRRIARKGTYTIGRLYVSGARFCDTLEDTDRGLTDAMTEAQIRRVKVYGRTAIPAVPRLLSVKGFDGVLIHPGNTDADTLGCILVGENKQVGKVLNSQATWARLMDRHLVPAAKKGEDITITIE